MAIERVKSDSMTFFVGLKLKGKTFVDFSEEEFAAILQKHLGDRLDASIALKMVKEELISALRSSG